MMALSGRMAINASRKLVVVGVGVGRGVGNKSINVANTVLDIGAGSRRRCYTSLSLQAERRWTRNVSSFDTTTITVRTHMNHGGGGGGNFMGDGGPSSQHHGPRQPVQLGLDIAKASQNVLRLLESSHGVHNYSAHYQDTSSPCWHATCGLRWTLDEDAESSSGEGWVARRPNDVSSSSTSRSSLPLHWIPTISWLQFSDDRTALAKLQAMDGSQRYISLLRLDQESPSSSSMVAANDGWVIVREVVAPTISPTVEGTDNNNNNGMTTMNTADDMTSLMECLQEYLNIEHGGGPDDYQTAKDVLFAPQATLVAVGMAPLNEAPTDWSAPVGSLLEIPLDTYLDGVAQQTPHDPASRRYDAIVQVDVTSGGTTSSSGSGRVATAAATVKVGNGAQTMVFVDHLLLGRRQTDDSSSNTSASGGGGGGHGWKILSKTFSPQLWED